MLHSFRSNIFKSHKFSNEKSSTVFISLCCRMIKRLSRMEYGAASRIIIINSLCLLKRNNLITLHAINTERCAVGKFGLIFVGSIVSIESYNVYKSSSSWCRMLQSISLEKASCSEFIDTSFMMKYYSRYYCLIKYWFFIIDETWIIILRSHQRYVWNLICMYVVMFK